LTSIFLVGVRVAQTPEDTLTKGFKNPPTTAQPRVWWHWMNGNITKEGIKLDLEWMHRSGIAGFQNFDAALQTPQVVDKRLVYMTPEWKDAFKYAVGVGDQLGMEMAIAGSPGWSETGGPWVPPAQGMKKYVWTETVLDGGARFNGKLAHPPTTTGAFQNLGVHEQFGPPAPHLPEFYADSVVIAFRVPSGISAPAAEQAQVTSSGEGLDPTVLSDGDLETTTKVPFPTATSESWIQFEYPEAHTVRAITFVTKDPGFIQEFVSGIPEKTLESSDDGHNFHKVVSLSGGRAPEHTISFDPVTAKYFRVTFKHNPPPPVPAWGRGDRLFGVRSATHRTYLLRSRRVSASLRSAGEPF